MGIGGHRQPHGSGSTLCTPRRSPTRAHLIHHRQAVHPQRQVCQGCQRHPQHLLALARGSCGPSRASRGRRRRRRNGLSRLGRRRREPHADALQADGRQQLAAERGLPEAGAAAAVAIAAARRQADRDAGNLQLTHGALHGEGHSTAHGRPSVRRGLQLHLIPHTESRPSGLWRPCPAPTTCSCRRTSARPAKQNWPTVRRKVLPLANRLTASPNSLCVTVRSERAQRAQTWGSGGCSGGKGSGGGKGAGGGGSCSAVRRPVAGNTHRFQQVTRSASSAAQTSSATIGATPPESCTLASRGAGGAGCGDHGIVIREPRLLAVRCAHVASENVTRQAAK